MFRMEGTRKNDSVLSLMRGGELYISLHEGGGGKNVPGIKNILPPPLGKILCTRLFGSYPFKHFSSK